MGPFIVLAGVVAAVSCSSILSENELQGHWQTFKAEHGRVYDNILEETYRMNVFKTNFIRVAKHNDRFDRGEVTFKVTINKFADMLAYEVAEMLNGFRLSTRQKSGRVHNISEPAARPARLSAEKVDWRTLGYVTDVKDQGHCGSCWAFSTTGSLEGQLFKKNGKLVSLSEQNLIDCSHGFGNAGCHGGDMYSATMYIKDNGGIDTEKSYPYEGQDSECRYNADHNAGTVTGFNDITFGENDEKTLYDAVKTVGPVTIGIDASHSSFHSYDSGIYYEPSCSSTKLDHAVLAVGFGSDGPNKDYWIVKNSWGKSWGEDGYIRMARNRNNNCGIATAAGYPTV